MRRCGRQYDATRCGCYRRPRDAAQRGDEHIISHACAVSFGYLPLISFGLIRLVFVSLHSRGLSWSCGPAYNPYQIPVSFDSRVILGAHLRHGRQCNACVNHAASYATRGRDEEARCENARGIEGSSGFEWKLAESGIMGGVLKPCDVGEGQRGRGAATMNHV